MNFVLLFLFFLFLIFLGGRRGESFTTTQFELFFFSFENTQNILSQLFEKILHFFLNSNLFLKQKDGTTPLCVAAQNGHEQMVQILLEKGANVDLANKVLFC